MTHQPLVNGEPAIEAGSSPEDLPPPCWMCTVPLVHERELMGVLALYTPKSAPFADQQVQLLELLAPRLSAAIASLPAQPAPVAEAPRTRRSAPPDLHLVRAAAR